MLIMEAKGVIDWNGSIIRTKRTPIESESVRILKFHNLYLWIKGCRRTSIHLQYSLADQNLSWINFNHHKMVNIVPV